ncbi:hypothetical protein SAY87_017017 [Trapa incisa]|uniref:H15 domain-containing protein n=1 Tax=Trapa incisa TaxID=236973 RepID=A0AAN7L7T1_9MYRT|nr:hypothetical protein SAY87_017017 [Trapa incisa]
MEEKSRKPMEEKPDEICKEEKPEELWKGKKLKEEIWKEEKPRKPRTVSHPPYFQMIKEALQGLNERSGSSSYAIAKFIKDKYKSILPTNFKKILNIQIKNSVGKGKLIKIKGSYKLSQASKKEKVLKTEGAKKPVSKQSNANKANATPPKKVWTSKKPTSAAKSVKKTKNAAAA